jgi:hypothetical protein
LLAAPAKFFSHPGVMSSGFATGDVSTTPGVAGNPPPMREQRQSE